MSLDIALVVDAVRVLLPVGYVAPYLLVRGWMEYISDIFISLAAVPSTTW